MMILRKNNLEQIKSFLIQFSRNLITPRDFSTIQKFDHSFPFN